MVKLVFCVRRLASVAENDFYDYWLNQHGPLVRSTKEALGICRYVQSHTRHKEMGEVAAGGRGMKVQAYDGVAELWWENIETLQGALASEAGQAAGAMLAEDEARFIDLEASTIFFTEEHTVIDDT